MFLLKSDNHQLGEIQIKKSKQLIIICVSIICCVQSFSHCVGMTVLAFVRLHLPSIKEYFSFMALKEWKF